MTAVSFPAPGPSDGAEKPVELDFDPAGVRCVLTIPVRKRSEFAMRAGRMGSRSGPASAE